MVNLFIVLIPIILTKKNAFSFFKKKTPNHQVILHNTKKHAEGSLFVANQMQVR